MIPITPQELADKLGLYLVRNNGVWYGCATPPPYDAKLKRWLVDKVRVEAVFATTAILYVGSDIKSLTKPR